MNQDSKVVLSLTPDEALVLFEWLTREDEKGSIPTMHEAEQEVLWTVEGQLERALVEPLRADYRMAVATARERVIGKRGETAR